MERPEPQLDVACPLLGLAQDRQTRFTYPHSAHRCHAGRVRAIAPAYQASRCLALGFVSCERLQAWARRHHVDVLHPPEVTHDPGADDSRPEIAAGHRPSIEELADARGMALDT